MKFTDFITAIYRDVLNKNSNTLTVLKEITDSEVRKAHNASGESHLYRLDLREVSTVGLDDARKHLVIDVWTPDKGVRTIKRK